MDFRLDDDQRAVLDAVDTLLGRHAGPDRLHALGGAEPAYDHELHKHLESAGFLDVADHGGPDRLDAALVQEAIAQALGSVASGFRLLVAPSIPVSLRGPVAVIGDGHRGPARFAADTDAIVVIGASDVRVVREVPALDRPASKLGWPVGDVGALPAGEVVEGVDPEEVTAWVRIALAVELAGTMRFATELTVGYVKDREQFGRPIGSFQAVQHGLAECVVAVEGARWLALEAASQGSPEAALGALTHAVEATKVVFPRTHQYCGAIGFTREFDLHLATMRLVALRAEVEALGRPAGDYARRCWSLA